MASVIDAMKAKSDQLNFVDIGAGGELVIFIERVVVTGGNEQTVHVHYSGCDNRPYKPSKGMIRLLAGAWGDDGDLWVGKSLKLFGDGSVTWGGGEVGGIRIAAMSDIDSAGYTAYIQKNRKVRVKQTIPLLAVDPVIAEISKAANASDVNYVAANWQGKISENWPNLPVDVQTKLNSMNQ